MADLRVRSEIAGSVWKIEVAVGDTVAEDDPLVILESMKMEIPLLAPRSGDRQGNPRRRGRADRRGRCRGDPRMTLGMILVVRAKFRG